MKRKERRVVENLISTYSAKKEKEVKYISRIYIYQEECRDEVGATEREDRVGTDPAKPARTG
jgi:hypothetical protein